MTVVVVVVVQKVGKFQMSVFTTVDHTLGALGACRRPSMALTNADTKSV